MELLYVSNCSKWAKSAKKTVWRGAFCLHFYRLLFRRFCPLGYNRSNNYSISPINYHFSFLHICAFIIFTNDEIKRAKENAEACQQQYQLFIHKMRNDIKYW